MTSTLQVTTDDVLSRVRDLLPGIAARVAQGDQERRLPEESAQAFFDAGLARILVPQRFGGYELGLDTWFDVVEAIGEVDAAQAWCASLMIHDSHYLAQMPLAAQEAVWADGPDVAIATSLAPMTRVEAVDGGFLLTGEGAWASGVEHCTWSLIGGMLPGTSRPTPALFLVPEKDYTVRDVWHTTGMRATGSNVVVTDGAFVPATHVLTIGDMMAGTGPGAAISDNPLYRAAMATYAPLTFIVPMLGAARGALALFQTWAQPRMGRPNANINTTSTLIRMGRAAADIDAAELLLRRSAVVAAETAPTPIELRARCMRDHARASELLLGAVNELVALSGTAGLALSNPLEKHWRDVNLAARHVTLNTDLNFSHWSGRQFDLPINPAEITAY